LRLRTLDGNVRAEGEVRSRASQKAEAGHQRRYFQPEATLQIQNPQSAIQNLRLISSPATSAEPLSSKLNRAQRKRRVKRLDESKYRPAISTAVLRMSGSCRWEAYQKLWDSPSSGTKR